MLAKLFAATLVTFLLFGAGLAADTADEASKKESAEKAETKTRKKGDSAAARTLADKKALEAQKKRAERIRKLRIKSTRRKLQTRRRYATLKFKNTPLTEVLKTLGKVGRFGVIIDPRLEKEEIDLSERLIDLRVPTGAVTYEQVLDMVLGKDLGYRVGPGHIYITTLERSWLPLVVVIYPVRYLMAEVRDHVGPRFDINSVIETGPEQGGGGGAVGGFFNEAPDMEEEDERRLSSDRLIELCQRFARHDLDRKVATWVDEGGPASVTYFRGNLVVTQTPAGHRRISKLLRAL